MSNDTNFYQDVVLDTLKSKAFLATDSSGKIIEGAGVTETDPLSLHLDQTTPQAVSGGIPRFGDSVLLDKNISATAETPVYSPSLQIKGAAFNSAAGYSTKAFGNIQVQIQTNNASPTVSKLAFGLGADDSSPYPKMELHTNGTVKFNSLTSNGFLKTSGSDGTLAVDTTAYVSGTPWTSEGYLTTVDISSDTNLAVSAPIVLSGDTLSVDASYERNEVNGLLTAWRGVRSAGSAYQLLMDGWVDGFKDETGIDTANCTNQVYDSTNDLYYPSASGASIPDLELHYLMNDNTNTTAVVDSSGNGHTGTAQANTDTKDTTGQINNALLFNGTSDYIDTGIAYNGISQEEFSLCGWFKYDGAHTGYITMFSNATTSNPGYQFLWYKSGGTMYFYNDGMGGSLGPMNSSVFDDNAWHFIVWRYKAGVAFDLWVDNAQLGTGNASYNGPHTLGNWKVGSEYGSGTNRYWSGAADDIRIYTRFITTDEMDLLWNGGSGTEDEFAEGGGGISDMTLISNAVTAESAPSTARITLLVDPQEAVTINTDIKAYVSRDGTNYTQITLADEGSATSAIDILTGEATISSASGTSMKYKIETLNGKDIDVHGAGVLWKD